MAVAIPSDSKRNNVVKSDVQPNVAKSDVEYASQVVDTRSTNYDAVATFMSGQRWAVDLYVQVLGRDDSSKSFSQDLLKAHSQLREIRGFEILVQSPLTQTQERSSDGPYFELSGSGNVYGVVPPNVGDFFIADIGDGRNAILQINSSKQNSIYQESSFEIEYKTFAWLDTKTQESIQARVVERLFFSRERLRTGLHPLLHEEEVHQSISVREHYDRLLGLYLRDFYSTKFKTFILPGQKEVTYDPHLVRFLKATTSAHRYPKLAEIIEYSLGYDEYGQQPTVLDAIRKRDHALLYSCLQEFGITPTVNFPAQVMTHSIYYSGIRAVVSPITYIRTVDNEYGAPAAPIALQKAGVRQNTPESIFHTLDLTTGEQADRPEVGSYIRRITDDNYYIFGKSFYSEGAGLTTLEKLVTDYLQNKPFDVSDLLKVCEYAPRFDNLERFYYVPILLALILMTPGVF